MVLKNLYRQGIWANIMVNRLLLRDMSLFMGSKVRAVFDDAARPLAIHGNWLLIIDQCVCLHDRSSPDEESTAICTNALHSRATSVMTFRHRQFLN